MPAPGNICSGGSRALQALAEGNLSERARRHAREWLEDRDSGAGAFELLSFIDIRQPDLIGSSKRMWANRQFRVILRALQVRSGNLKNSHAIQLALTPCPDRAQTAKPDQPEYAPLPAVNFPCSSGARMWVRRDAGFCAVVQRWKHAHLGRVRRS